MIASRREWILRGEFPADGKPRAIAVAFRAIAPELTALSDAERGLLVDWLDRAIDGEAR